MPHYADGTEAKVGDQVTGKLYNSGGVKAGTIVSITPGVESCNAMVQFTEAVALDQPAPRMAVLRSGEPDSPDYMKHEARRFRGEAHGSAGEERTLYVCADYCATNELTKVG